MIINFIIEIQGKNKSERNIIIQEFIKKIIEKQIQTNSTQSNSSNESNETREDKIVGENNNFNNNVNNINNSNNNNINQNRPVNLKQNQISAKFSENLWKGMRGNSVLRLQELLATDPTLYPAGITSGFYGFLTQQAVQRFQLRYNVVSSPRSPGYGVVGPRTRAMLERVFGG